MSTTDTPKARRKRRPSRWALLSIIALLVGAGFVVTGVGGTPAAQAGFLGICDADTTFPTPADPGGTTQGITHSSVTSTPTANAGSENVDPKTYTVILPGYGQKTPLQQYAGGGLHWYPYAMSCMDSQPQVQSLVANWIFEIVALWPLRILGLLMQLSFSTMISDALLAAASGMVANLETSVWASWSPIIIMAVLAAAAIKVARGRGRESYSKLLWVVGVSVVVTSALTGPGLNLLTSLNGYARQITGCVTFTVTGAGCATNTTSQSSLYADSMVESLAVGVWSTGALGDLARKTPLESNGSWNLTIKHREGTPDLDDNTTIHLVTSAIPAKLDGSPTWAEVLRWTQTYTNAEVAAMEADPSLQCTKSPDQSPSSFDITNLDDGDNWDPGQLCSYKWLVRAAVASELFESHPQAYATFRGVTQETWTAALAGTGLLPLSIGIGVMGIMVLLYQIELVVLFIVAPLVGLVSLKSANAARRWAEMIGASLVKRVAVGFVLGVTIWLASLANQTFSTTISGPYGVTLVPAKLIPIAASIITILCMVVGFMLLKKVQAMLLEGVELPNQPGMADGAMDKAKQGGKKVLEMGVAASAGALAAGTGLRGKGAWRGLTRSNAFGGSVGRAFRSGDHAGFYIGNQQDREASAADKAQKDQERDSRLAATTAERQATKAASAKAAFTKARNGFETAPQFRPTGWDEARTAQQRAGAARTDQEVRIQEKVAAREPQVWNMMQQVQATEPGVTPEAARERATAQWDAQMASELETLRQLDQALAATTEAMKGFEAGAQQRAGMVVNAMSEGASIEDVRIRFGLDDKTTDALRQYVDATQAYRATQPSWDEYSPDA